VVEGGHCGRLQRALDQAGEPDLAGVVLGFLGTD
jgi:hypothetical protein